MKCFNCLNCEPCPPGIFICSHYSELIPNPNKELVEPCDTFLITLDIIDAKALLVGAKSKFKDNREMQIALNMGIEALGMQIPKKPILEKWSAALCPGCKEELSEHMGDGYYKHWDSLDRCPECGQRLEWD